MTRILVVVRWPVGGIRTFLKYVYATELAEEFEITIAMPDMPESRQLEADMSGYPVSFQWLPVDKIGYVRTLRCITRNSEFSVVHSHGFTALALTTVASLGIRHITTVHDVLLSNQLAGFAGELKRQLLRWALGRTHLVHTVSHACADNIREMLPQIKGLDAKLRVIPNGIDSGSFSDALPVDLRRETGRHESTLMVGFFGRFMGQKGFRHVIDAVDLWRAHETRELTVVAVGSGGFKARELREIEAKELQEYFVFFDFVPHVGPLMKSVDVVLMPSLWEACGLVAMEALVSGAPIIVSDIPALREIVNGAPAIVVEPASGKSIYSALRELDVDLEKSGARAYADIAAERFSVGRVVAAISSAYKEADV